MPKISELIIDAYGCQCNLNDIRFLESSARRAVRHAGAHIVEKMLVRFQPHGMTLCLALKESHFILSTWPEHHLAITNIFLCNPEMNPTRLWDEFSQALSPDRSVIHEVIHHLGPLRKAA